MKNILFITLLSFIGITNSYSQTEKDKKSITRTCLDYMEGFYEGDTLKIKNSIIPTLHKFGFWKDKNSGEYKEEGFMTYSQAITYSKNVLKSKRFVSKKAPKKVEILDVSNHIASVKITAWWGIDYMLLSRKGEKWVIRQVLWEGPLQR